MLVHGNLTGEHAAALGDELVATLKVLPLAADDHPVTNVTRVEPGAKVLEIPNPNPNDDNSCIEVYYQLGGNDMRDAVLTDLLYVAGFLVVHLRLSFCKGC
jgi:hypothetical protein